MPTARRSRPSTGSPAWQRHIGSLAGVKPAIVVAWRGSDTLVAASARRRARQAGAPPDLPRPGAVRLQRAAARARFRRAHRDRFRRAVAGHPPPDAGGACAALRHDQFRQDARSGRHATQSDALSRRAAQSERRLRNAARHRLGAVLHVEALIRDATARPHQAQAPRRARRGEIRRSAAAGRDRRDARCVDPTEDQVVRAHGGAQHVRAARPCGVLP